MKQKILIAVTLAGIAGAGRMTAADVDFVKEVAPILQKSCVECHGPTKQKGGLRLDTKAAAFKGGKNGEVIVPGHADKSELYRRISLAPGSDDIMPNKGDPLGKPEIELIMKWINAGAAWPDSATVTIPVETPPAPATNPYQDLVVIKPPSAETAAMAKLETGGGAIKLLAMNMNWHEAGFRNAGTNVTDATIGPLAEFPTLVDLNLAGTRVSDAGLKSLKGLTNLVALHLEHTKITDAGLAHLRTLPHLYYLNLYDTPITDKGLEQLNGMKSLRRLFLWETKVTAKGAEDLQKALPQVQISRGWENEPGAQKADPAPAEKKPEMKMKKDAKKDAPKDDKKDDKK